MLVIISVFLIISCKKESTVSNRITFLKTYETDFTASAEYPMQMPDGGFIIVCSKGAGQLMLIRTDKYGKLAWSKIIQQYGFPPYGADVFQLSNGSNFIVHPGSGSNIIKFDTTGKILANITNPDNLGFSSMIQQGSNFILPASSGYGSQGPSINKIYIYNQNLILQSTYSFNDPILGGKTLGFFLNNISSRGDYNILGYKFPNSNWTYNDNSKLFAARISSSGKVIQTIINATDQKHDDISNVAQANANDSEEILLGWRVSLDIYHSSYPVVVKFDNNLDTVWEKDFPVNADRIVPYTINHCNDGGFIIVGTIRKTGFSNNLPYALKIDQNGNKQWDKTIDAQGGGEFQCGINLNDGGYVFVGDTPQFGEGLNGTRILFIKTDANGNY